MAKFFSQFIGTKWEYLYLSQPWVFKYSSCKVLTDWGEIVKARYFENDSPECLANDQILFLPQITNSSINNQKHYLVKPEWQFRENFIK